MIVSFAALNLLFQTTFALTSIHTTQQLFIMAAKTTKTAKKSHPIPRHISEKKELEQALILLEKCFSTCRTDQDGGTIRSWSNPHCESLADELEELIKDVEADLFNKDKFPRTYDYFCRYYERGGDKYTKKIFDSRVFNTLNETYSIFIENKCFIPWMALPDILSQLIRINEAAYYTFITTVSRKKSWDKVKDHYYDLRRKLWQLYTEHFSESTVVCDIRLEFIRAECLRTLKEFADIEEYVEANLTTPLDSAQMQEYMSKTYPGQKIADYYYYYDTHLRCVIPQPNTLRFWDSVKGCSECKKLQTHPPKLEYCPHGCHPTSISLV